MKEDFLRTSRFKIQYSRFEKHQGENLIIINVGQYLELSGPDFQCKSLWEDQNGQEM
jgi:hypothetical protein